MTGQFDKLKWAASTGLDLSPGDPVAAWAVDEIERLRAALADQVRREETARCVRCGCTAFICGTEIAAQPEETTGGCALSVSPSALQGTNSNDISTLDGT